MLQRFLFLLLGSVSCALRLESACSLNRRTFLASSCFTTVAPLSPAWASADETLALLKQARTQLEPCEGFLGEGNWDGVRNVIKTAPLANVKNLVTKYISEQGEEAEDLVAQREDLVQALSMLDMTTYNNVFVSEELGMGKKGAGVKIDRATVQASNSLAHHLTFTPIGMQ